MNWYKKILAQSIVNDLEYPTTSDESRYFSIGQSGIGEYGYCWIYDGKELRSKKGGTHSMNFPDIFSRYKERKNPNFNIYRGWYDPNQKLISVIIPRDREQVNPPSDPSSLPTKLRVALSDEFGTDNQIMVF